MLFAEVEPVMEVVLVIASMLLLASVAAAVALDRGPFAAPPARPGTAPAPRPGTAPPARPGTARPRGAGPVHPGPPPAGAALPPGSPPARSLPGLPLPDLSSTAAAGRWAGREASVRACDDLQAQLRAGRLSGAAYRKAMADLAAAHDRRHPLPIPPEK
jgi:hypothetical protein